MSFINDENVRTRANITITMFTEITKREMLTWIAMLKTATYTYNDKDNDKNKGNEKR